MKELYVEDITSMSENRNTVKTISLTGSFSADPEIFENLGSKCFQGIQANIASKRIKAIFPLRYQEASSLYQSATSPT